jgi:hypothetical protein
LHTLLESFEGLAEVLRLRKRPSNFLLASLMALSVLGVQLMRKLAMAEKRIYSSSALCAERLRASVTEGETWTWD